MSRIVNARMKTRDEFPPVEFCCEEVIGLMKGSFGIPLRIDLDDQIPYVGKVGHCGQPLGYKNSVMVIGSSYNTGYVPFELIEIDEKQEKP